MSSVVHGGPCKTAAKPPMTMYCTPWRFRTSTMRSTSSSDGVLTEDAGSATTGGLCMDRPSSEPGHATIPFRPLVG